MDHPLRVAVADADGLLHLRDLMRHLGHEVVAEASSGPELVEQCRAAQPDLVITEVTLAGLDGLAAAEEIDREWDVPVVIVSARDDDKLLERAASSCVASYLVKPVRDADLKAAIAVALPRFARQHELGHEVEGLRRDLEDCKQAERVSGALAERLGVRDEEAVRAVENVIDRWARL